MIISGKYGKDTPRELNPPEDAVARYNERMKSLSEYTVAILKPECSLRVKEADVLQLFGERGLVVSGKKQIMFNDEFLDDFYGKQIRDQHLDFSYMTRDPCLILIVQGLNAVGTVRDMVLNLIRPRFSSETMATEHLGTPFHNFTHAVNPADYPGCEDVASTELKKLWKHGYVQRSDIVPCILPYWEHIYAIPYNTPSGGAWLIKPDINDIAHPFDQAGIAA